MKKKLNVTFELLTVKAALEAIKLGSKFRLNCVTKSILLMAIIFLSSPRLASAANAWSVATPRSLVSAARLSQVLNRQPLTVTSYMSVFVVPALFALPIGTQAQFPLPDGSTATLVTNRIIHHADGFITFVGHLAGMIKI